MLYLEVFSHHSDCFVEEMSALIIHRYFQESKSGDHIVKKKPHRCHGCAILYW